MMLLFDGITLPLEDPILKFLLILVIILAAPLLLNKLKIPYLLGLIIAGAVIGPHGLNLVLRDSSIILSEYEASGAVLAEIRHVHIQAGEEHDVEQSGRTGEDDAAVA